MLIPPQESPPCWHRPDGTRPARRAHLRRAPDQDRCDPRRPHPATDPARRSDLTGNRNSHNAPEGIRHDGDPVDGAVPTTTASGLGWQIQNAERPGLASLAPWPALLARRSPGWFGAPSQGAGCRHPAGWRSRDRTPPPATVGRPGRAWRAAGHGRGGSAGRRARRRTRRPVAWRRRRSSWSRLSRTARWTSFEMWRFRGSWCRDRDGIGCTGPTLIWPAWTLWREPRGLLHAHLFTCGWRASHSLVEVYRLARVGIDQADRL